MKCNRTNIERKQWIGQPTVTCPQNGYSLSSFFRFAAGRRRSKSAEKKNEKKKEERLSAVYFDGVFIDR